MKVTFPEVRHSRHSIQVCELNKKRLLPFYQNDRLAAVVKEEGRRQAQFKDNGSDHIVYEEDELADHAEASNLGNSTAETLSIHFPRGRKQEANLIHDREETDCGHWDIKAARKYLARDQPDVLPSDRFSDEGCMNEEIR